MPSAGPSLPTVGANDASAGVTAWTNPGNITANDGTSATAAGLAFGTSTQLLVGTALGFSIPAGATIDGIEVVIDRGSTGDRCRDVLVSLYLGGVVIGDNKADTALQWPAALTEKTYGGAADTWGAGMTAENVNDAGFGIAVQCEKNLSGIGGPSVDYLSMTITYTEASGITSRSMLMGAGR